MNAEKEPYVRIGDFVILSGHCEAFKNKEMKGVLSSLGFTEHQIFFQALPFELDDSKLTEQPQSVALIRNYRDFIFQIWPKLNYEAHKEFRRLSKDKPKYEKLKQSNNREDHQAAAEFGLTLLKIQDRAEAEHKANLASLETNFGLTVQYDSEIQLMHVDSRMFITGKTDTSESELSAYRFQLSDTYDSRMIFKILPKYKVYQTGSPVQFDDEVYLYNTKLDCYVNFAPEAPIDIDTSLKTNEKAKLLTAPYKMVDLRKPDPNSLRYLAHLSQYQDTTWRLRLHARRQHRYAISVEKHISKSIHGGDLIRLRQPETRSCIAADLNYQGLNPEVYIREYFGPMHEENSAANEIWEIEKICINERGMGIESRSQDWNFEDDPPEKIELKLRHFLTGRLMALTEVTLHDKKRMIPILAPLHDEKQALSSTNSVFFVPTIYQSHKSVQNGSSYGIGFHGDTLFLTSTEDITYTINGAGVKVAKSLENILSPRDSITDLERVQQTSIPNFYTPQKDSDTWIKRKAIFLDNQKSTQHTFYVEKLTEFEKGEVLYVASAVHRLQHFLHCIKTQQTSVFTHEYLKKLIQILGQLILFVMETNKYESVNPLEYEGNPIVSRQKLLKDMYLIELLTDILYYPFHLKLYETDDISDEGICQVFQHCYKLIRMAIHEFRVNELYASQWLELFIYQTLATNQKSNILAGPTLTELIDNNRKILETRINLKTIEKFVESLKNPFPNKKFVDLVRALIICDGEALVANQEIISNMILTDEKAFDCVCYRLKQDLDGEIYVRVTPYNKLILLKELASYVYETDENYEVYEYFISAIELLADLCLSRNFTAIDKIQHIYPKELCCSIIPSASYNPKLRTAFAKLLNNLWIDRDYEAIDLPNYLFTWDEISARKCDDLFNYNNVPNTFESYKLEIQNYLKTIAEKGFLRAYDKENNLLTIEILENLKTLLKMGYYSSLRDLEEILPFLLTILNGFKDVTKQSEEVQRRSTMNHLTPVVFEQKHALSNEYIGTRYKNTPETHLLMQIKIKILQMIEFIVNYINDFRVRRILFEFNP